MKFTLTLVGRKFEMQALDIESRDFWVLSLERLRIKIKEEEEVQKVEEQEGQDQMVDP